MLVAAGLVYDKMFSSKDKGQPPIWGIDFIQSFHSLYVIFSQSDLTVFSFANEIAIIVAFAKPQLVDFDDMLMDRPSPFTRVAIVTKTKPRESLVLEATSTSPPPTNSAPTPAINPLLKRMATVVPSASQPSKKAKKCGPPKKKATQVLARDTSAEASQAHGVQPATRVVVPPSENVGPLELQAPERVLQDDYISSQGLLRYCLPHLATHRGNPGALRTPESTGSHNATLYNLRNRVLAPTPPFLGEVALERGLRIWEEEDRVGSWEAVRLY
ncbi:hypothetical protein LIER_11223 [Lithospermum erythrorhizon]|uniref:Uncharacterized protein n=1 Tax=Lithospermum erythrorhizon TaxID=34254 RepID=A0AAV3PP01_LITER